VTLESVLVLLVIGVIGFWISRRDLIPEKVEGDKHIATGTAKCYNHAKA
jgi:hypothetical protein